MLPSLLASDQPGGPYDVGQSVTLTLDLPQGLNPASVSCEVMSPSATQPVMVALETTASTSTGTVVTTNDPGVWAYRFITGGPADAVERTFRVNPSRFQAGVQPLDGPPPTSVLGVSAADSTITVAGTSQYPTIKVAPGQFDVAGTAAAAVSTEATARTTAINDAINALVNGAPTQLDTLNEIASALNDDANLAATLTAEIAGKQPLAPTLTTLAGLTPTAVGEALLQVANVAAAQAMLGIQPGSARVITHTFTEAEAADVANGYATGAIELYTPEPGDLLIDAGFFASSAFTVNTGNIADFGTFANTDGTLAAVAGVFGATNYGNAASFVGVSPGHGGSGLVGLENNLDSLAALWAENYSFSPPLMFTETFPLRLIVSADGKPNSAPLAAGGTGQATVYVIVVTPQTV